MNPFIFNPKSVATVAARNYVIGLYKQEIATAADVQRQVDERLAAVVDVLKERAIGPAEAQTLIEEAYNAGQAARQRANLETLQQEFVVALPYSIRIAQ